jgi:hypothetical protein
MGRFRDKKLREMESESSCGRRPKCSRPLSGGSTAGFAARRAKLRAVCDDRSTVAQGGVVPPLRIPHPRGCGKITWLLVEMPICLQPTALDDHNRVVRILRSLPARVDRSAPAPHPRPTAPSVDQGRRVERAGFQPVSRHPVADPRVLPRAPQRARDIRHSC